MIKSINLKDSFAESDIKIEQDRLDNLSRMNLFVGQNNSGKSRFIRSLYCENLVYVSNSPEFVKLENAKKKFQNGLSKLKELNDFRQDGRILGLKSLEIREVVEESADQLKYFQTYLNKVASFSPEDELISYSIGGNEKRKVLRDFTELVSTLNQVLQQTPKTIADLSFPRTMVPILRGLRPFSKEKENDVYKRRTVQDYFPKYEGMQRHSIYTGLSLFEDLKKLLLGSSDERQKVRDFEIFLQYTFFNSEIVNVVPRIGEDVVYVLIGEEEYPIYELGDGIQSIIILTYPLFFNADKKELVFIEEPEQYLHPGMQRILIKTLLSHQFKNKQFFVTSHSNHFLELVNEYEDVSLYSVSKKTKKEGIRVQQQLVPDTNLLDLLGVNNASVFMANCTLWVEGITDRLYIRQYLEIYWKEKNLNNSLKEDFDYAFVEYSGGNIVHWDFSGENEENITAEKISNKIFLVADSDFDSDGEIPEHKAKRFDNLQNQLNERFYQLPVKEIENTLDKEVIKRIITRKEKISLSKLSANKGIRYNYEKKNLGEWIDSNFTGLKKTYKKDNTIADKLGFARIAISEMKSYEDLSLKAIDLCEKITAFIQSNKLD